MAKTFKNDVRVEGCMRLYTIHRLCRKTNRWIVLGVSELTHRLEEGRYNRTALAMRIRSIRRIVRERTGFYEGR